MIPLQYPGYLVYPRPVNILPSSSSRPGLTGFPGPMLLRYTSVPLCIFGGYLYWAGDNFSESFCRGFWFLPALFKCTQLLLRLCHLIDGSGL